VSHGDLREAMDTLADLYGPSTTDLHARAVRTARATSRRRTVLAGLAVVAIVAGVALVARPERSSAPPPPGSTTSPPAPTATANPDLSGRAAIVVAPGALDLADATLDLPEMGYPAPGCVGRIRLTDFRNVSPMRTVLVTREWTGDVDRDGRPDTLAMVVCQTGEMRQWQVVALTRAGAAMRTLGQVLAIGPRPAPASLVDLRVLPGGDVAAKVGDFLGVFAADARRVSTHQERTYRWTGSRFAQVAGPTEFPPNPHLYDLRITSATLRLGPISGDVRPATLTVAVANAGPGAAGEVSLSVEYPAASLPGTDRAWRTCTTTVDQSVAPQIQTATCALGVIGANTTRTVTLSMTVPAILRVGQFTGRLTAEVIGYDAMGWGYKLEPLPNLTTVTVTG
jgi:hypothetical protein